jgi:hypothetical protein
MMDAWIALLIVAAIVTAALFIFRMRIMYPAEEGFSAPVAGDAKITPTGQDEMSGLQPAAAGDPSTEKLVASAALPAMSESEARANWGAMTSERCYRSDIGESLKQTRNYAQRTNNYARTHPDDCSAPNHEFIGTFYTPFEGVGRYPKNA